MLYLLVGAEAGGLSGCVFRLEAGWAMWSLYSSLSAGECPQEKWAREVVEGREDSGKTSSTHPMGSSAPWTVLQRCQRRELGSHSCASDMAVHRRPSTLSVSGGCLCQMGGKGSWTADQSSDWAEPLKLRVVGWHDEVDIWESFLAMEPSRLEGWEWAGVEGSRRESRWN